MTMKIKASSIDYRDCRGLIEKAVEYRNTAESTQAYTPPETMGKPKDNKTVIAMDNCLQNTIGHQMQAIQAYAFPRFIGYGLLANLQQEGLVRAGVEVVADDLTRKFITIVQEGSDEDGKAEDKIKELTKDLKKFHIKEAFHGASLQCGFMGGCLVYIDCGDLDDEEKLTPLIIDDKLFKKGSFRGLRVIDPINIYPGLYNTDDPTSEDFFNPKTWFIMGKEYHRSRFLYFVQNKAPLLLKPSYNFFGISQTQLCLDYINHFTKNRESAQRLLEKFSLTAWKTDMSQVLSGGSADSINLRAKFLAKQRSNDGIMMLDKELEDIVQVNTPLGGVTEIVQMSLDLLTVVFHQPDVKLFGKNPKGLGGSDAEAIRIYYDYILGLAEKMFADNLEKIVRLLQMNRYGTIDETITYKINTLWEMDENEIAQLNQVKANTDVALINAGVISAEEVRGRIALDPESGYAGIDVEEVPENPMMEQEDESDEEENEEKEEKPTDETDNG